MSSAADNLRVMASSLDAQERFFVADVRAAIRRLDEWEADIRRLLAEYDPPGGALTTDPLFHALLADLRELVQ